MTDHKGEGEKEAATPPASGAEHSAFTSNRVAPIDEVRDGIWVLPIPIPYGAARLPATLCGLVEDDRGALHLVDAGVDEASSIDALRRALASIGRSIDDVASVTVTHLHADHLGAAERVREATGAAVIVHERERGGVEGTDVVEIGRALLETWGVPAERTDELERVDDRAAFARPLRVDGIVRDGSTLPISGHSLRVVGLPGHTAGSMGLVVEGADLIFVGDVVLPVTHAGIGLGGSSLHPVADHLDSLRRLARLGDLEVVPGHEFRFRGIAERCASTARHHLRRAHEVEEVLQDHPDAAVWDVATRLRWSSGFDALNGYMLRSALQQTSMHMDFVRSPALAQHLR